MSGSSKVDLPAGTTAVNAGLRLREKDRDVPGFGTGVSGPIEADTKREVLIAVIPIGGTLNDADKVRVVLSGFGIYSDRTEENPFRQLAVGAAFEMPENDKDGTFNLIGGYEGSTVSSPLSSAHKVLSLKIETSKQQRVILGFRMTRT